MTLYGWELKKIWRRSSARLALSLTLVWALLGILVNLYYNLSYKPDGLTPRISGPQEVANQLAWAEAWRGPLTGEKLAAAQQIVYDYYHDPDNRAPDGNLTNDSWQAVIRPLGAMPNSLMDMAAAVYELFHTQIGVGNRLDGGLRRVKKYLWSF